MNDSLLYQKSKIKWLKEGDANTKYIHFVVKGRRRANNLVGLELASGWTEDIKQVKRGVKTFFEIKFRKQQGLRPYLDGILFRTVSEEDKLMLCSEFSP